MEGEVRGRRRPAEPRADPSEPLDGEAGAERRDAGDEEHREYQEQRSAARCPGAGPRSGRLHPAGATAPRSPRRSRRSPTGSTRTVASARGPRRSGRTTPRRPRRARPAPRRLRPRRRCRWSARTRTPAPPARTSRRGQLARPEDRADRRRDHRFDDRLHGEPDRTGPVRAGAPPRSCGPRRRGGGRRHDGGRHPKPGDQQQAERALDGSRAPLRLTDHDRRRRAELRIATPDEERVQTPGPAAAREQPTDLRPSMRHLVHHAGRVRPELAGPRRA